MELTINDIFYAVLTVVLPLVLRYAYQLVSAKVAGSKYDKAVTAVADSVTYVTQTFVDALKEQGRFDEEAQSAAFRRAKDAALETMEAGVRSWLEKSVANLDEWLEVQIEAAVRKQKSGAV